jgi:CheY-like chemotaxis protein
VTWLAMGLVDLSPRLHYTPGHPEYRPRTVARHHHSSPEEVPVEPIKILLVDDSTPARYVLRLQLQRHGVQVDTAESAEAALGRIRESPPDAILMDHTMPGMNGFEALEILKSSPDTAYIPVVMCTAHDDPAFSAQAVRRGALGVLAKTAAERLPPVLDQIRAALAQGSLSKAPPAPEAAREPAPPVPAGPSREEIETLVEERLGVVLPARLAEVVDPLVARINTQLRQVIAEHMQKRGDSTEDPEAMQRRLNRVESTVNAQAVEIARREVADSLKATETQGLIEALAALRRSLGLSYALGSIALMLALGAVAFRLLSG